MTKKVVKFVATDTLRDNKNDLSCFKVWVNDYIEKAFDKNDIDGIEIRLEAFKEVEDD